jgi:hypothetical protein
MKDKYLRTDSYQEKKDKGEIPEPVTYANAEMEGDDKKKFFLKWANFIWTQHLFGNHCFNQHDKPLKASSYSLQEIRDYALGRQDTQRYREILDDCKDDGKGYININWDNTMIASKFRDIVRGKMLSVDFDVRTQAIDETSQKERLGHVNKVKAAISPQMKALAQVSGAQPNVEIPRDAENADDIDLIDKLGGFRLDRELFLKDAIEATKYYSGYNVLKGQLIDDMIDWNRCACRVYIEKVTNKVKFDYVSPLQVIIADSKYPDFRDAVYVGIIHTKTISQLRKESDLSEDELFQIAKLYKSNRDNNNFNVLPSLHSINNNKEVWQQNRHNNWDNFNVSVLEFYFVCNEVEKYIVGIRDEKDFFDKVKNTSKLNNGDVKKGKSFQEIHQEVVYRGNMVIGTDFVFDCDKEYGIAKKNKNGVRESILPVQVYADKSTSIMERCIPFIDDLQLAVLKKRNLLAKLPPGPRTSIDLSLLNDSIKIGGKSYNMLELFALYSKTGLLVYSSRSEYELRGEGGSSRPPIDNLPAGIVEDLQILMQEIELQINHIRQVTGINEVSDGSTQQQDMLAGVMNGLNSATNNALKPIFEGYKNITENWVKTCALKWQVAVLGGDINIEFIPMADDLLKRVKLTEDLYDCDFGIMLSILPSEDEKNLFLQDLVAKNQQGAIAIDDYFILLRMIKGGDMKRAELYLSKSVKKQTEMLQQQEMQKIQAQGQANAQAAQAAEAARSQTIQQELATKIELEKAKGEEHRKNLEVEYKLKIELEQVRVSGMAQNNLLTTISQDAINTQPLQQKTTSILEQNQL